MGKTKTERYVAINVTVPQRQLDLAQEIGTTRDESGNPIRDADGNPIVNTSQGIRVLCDAGALLQTVLGKLEQFKADPIVTDEVRRRLEEILDETPTMVNTDS